MNTENNSIPDIRVENIGSKAKPRHVAKGFITLPCWNGHYLYDDAYKLKKIKVVTDGYIELWVDNGVGGDDQLHLSGEQVNAYSFLVEHQEKIKRSILDTLKQEFPLLLSGAYGSWDHDQPFFPKLTDLNLLHFVPHSQIPNNTFLSR